MMLKRLFLMLYARKHMGEVVGVANVHGIGGGVLISANLLGIVVRDWDGDEMARAWADVSYLIVGPDITRVFNEKVERTHKPPERKPALSPEEIRDHVARMADRMFTEGPA